MGDVFTIYFPIPDAGAQSLLNGQRAVPWDTGKLSLNDSACSSYSAVRCNELAGVALAQPGAGINGFQWRSSPRRHYTLPRCTARHTTRRVLLNACGFNILRRAGAVTPAKQVHTLVTQPFSSRLNALNYIKECVVAQVEYLILQTFAQSIAKHIKR